MKTRLTCPCGTQHRRHRRGRPGREDPGPPRGGAPGHGVRPGADPVHRDLTPTVRRPRKVGGLVGLGEARQGYEVADASGCRRRDRRRPVSRGDARPRRCAASSSPAGAAPAALAAGAATGAAARVRSASGTRSVDGVHDAALDGVVHRPRSARRTPPWTAAARRRRGGRCCGSADVALTRLPSIVAARPIAAAAVCATALPRCTRTGGRTSARAWKRSGRPSTGRG